MKKGISILYTILFTTTFYLSGQNNIKHSQDGMSHKWLKENGNYKTLLWGVVGSIDINYFIGEDVDNFKTTLLGFGSIGYGLEKPIASIGNNRYELFLNLGFSLRKYRFENNLKLTKSDNYIEDEIVKDPPYEYSSTFFSWSKNKMVVGYLTIPLGFDYKSKFLDIRLQISYINYLSGKHKLKYIEDEDEEFESKGKVTLSWLVGESRQKYKTPNSEFKEYYLNKNNLTAALIFIPRISGKRTLGVGFRYDILPFFTEGKGPDINAVAIIISFYGNR